MERRFKVKRIGEISLYNPLSILLPETYLWMKVKENALLFRAARLISLENKVLFPLNSLAWTVPFSPINVPKTYPEGTQPIGEKHLDTVVMRTTTVPRYTS